MKYPHSISTILRGKWAIDLGYALSYGPVLNRLLNSQSDISVESVQVSAAARSADPEENKLYSYDDAPQGSIAVISMSGAMLKHGDMCSYGTLDVANAIRYAANHGNIAGIIFDIDSGGGSVDSIFPLVSAIEHAQKMNKPVIAWCDLCASAAYYVAVHCDTIIGSNNISPSEFGSIGVLASFWDVVPFFEKQGYKFHLVYAPESTDKNKTIEEALKGNYDLLKKELSSLAIKFQETVKEKRAGKLNASADGVLSGAMFAVDEAISIGLCDEKGDIDVAIAKCVELIEIKNFLKK